MFSGSVLRISSARFAASRWYGPREMELQGTGRNSAGYEEPVSRRCLKRTSRAEASRISASTAPIPPRSTPVVAPERSDDKLHNSLHNPGLRRLTREIVGDFFDAVW